MKALKFFLVVCFQVVLISANAWPAPKNAQPYITKTFTIDEPGELQVRTSGGSIDVSSHEGNKVVVEMYVRKGGKDMEGDAEIQEALEDYEIEIEGSSNKVIASAIRESGNWFKSSKNINISFKVYVPARTSCQLNTNGGSISLKGVSGKHDVNTSGGSLNFVEIDGDMKARTSGGSINIEDYAGTLEAKTSGGSIKVKGAQGEIVLHTSGGSIDLKDLKGSVEASTSGGGIKADLLTLEKQLKLSTSGGSINATIPSGLGVDLNLKGNRVKTKLSNFSGEVKENKVVGSMNGGGILVELSTSGGNVNLEYR